MNQYEYNMTDKRTGRTEHARATAVNAVIAHAQIVLAYGQQFDVCELYCDINPPHYTLGEIDCSGHEQQDEREPDQRDIEELDQFTRNEIDNERKEMLSRERGQHFDNYL